MIVGESQTEVDWTQRHQKAGVRLETSNEITYALICCHHNVRSDRRSKMSEGDTTPTATPALPTMYT